MAYVYGNTVRKEADVPRRNKQVVPKHPQKTSRQVRKNRKKALRMSPGYVIFLAVAAVAALIVCTKYLQLQSEISNHSRNITALQEELEDLREKNTTKYNAIMNSVNMEDVRNKAMNEFGMIYSTPEQIIKYKSPTSNAVKQYENIPKSGILAGSDKIKK